MPNIDGAKLLVNLTPSELDELCTYNAEVDGSPHTIQCSNGNTVMIVSVDQCVIGAMEMCATSTATVDDDETCAEEIAADPCTALANSACTIIESGC